MNTEPLAQERWLVLMRHAQAGDPERFFRETGRPDRERPLTAAGRVQNRSAANGLLRLLKRVDHLWSSPYVRAQHTAQGIGEAFGHPAEAPAALLPPWDGAGLTDWLESRLRPGETAILVGHEPDLSALLGRWLCGSEPHSPVPMEKGTACALRISGPIRVGSVELLWKVPQYCLRKL